LRHLVPLRAVAIDACGQDVRPFGLAACGARDDVVEGQIGSVKLFAAILAAEPVAQKDRAPAEFRGAVDRRIVAERDYLRHADLRRRGAENNIPFLDHRSTIAIDGFDCLLRYHEGQRPNAQGPVVGVQDQRAKGGGHCQKLQ
jgi:hypothetical protein